MGGIFLSAGAWSAGAERQVVFDQNRAAASETTTEGDTLVSAHVSRTIDLARGHVEIFMRGTNLTDDEARTHTSFVKDLAPLAGRGAVAGVRFAF